MKKIINNTLIVLLIFLFGSFFMILSFAAIMGAFADNLGIEKGTGFIISFLVAFGLSWLALLGFRKRIGFSGVMVTLGVVILALMILNGYNTTIKYSIKILPFYINWIFGLLAGYYYYSGKWRRKYLLIGLALYPIIMAAGVNDLWHHKIEYGNWTGNVEAEAIAPFEFLDKNESIVSNKSLKGRVVLLDFWFVRCPPCWVKFPELQKIYENYKDNDSFALYAVNRNDDPEELFSKIEEKGYTFPVLRGNQDLMDALGIYKYPTVMILDKDGKNIFLGNLDDAEKKLEYILNADP
jgi:thiol-disulfide isomerase/thioredoxin